MTRTVADDGITDGNGRTTDPVHLIQTQVASSDSSIVFVLPGGYRKFTLSLMNVRCSSDGSQPFIRTSSNGGASFDSGGSDYAWTYFNAYGTSSTGVAGDTSDAQMKLGVTQGSGANEFFSGNVDLLVPAAIEYTSIFWNGTITTATGNFAAQMGHGRRSSAAVVDAIQFLMSSGTVVSGVFQLHGWAA